MKNHLKILAYFSDSFTTFLNLIFKSKKWKLDYFLRFSIERQQHEIAKYLMDIGANPVSNEGLSLIVVHNYNHDYKMLDIIIKNKYYLNWEEQEKFVKDRIQESKYKKKMQIAKLKRKVEEF